MPKSHFPTKISTKKFNDFNYKRVFCKCYYYIPLNGRESKTQKAGETSDRGNRLADIYNNEQKHGD